MWASVAMQQKVVASGVGAGAKAPHAFIKAPNAKPVHLVLAKNLSKSVQSERGWLGRC